ncbi:MAG TPA: transketolase [Alphaproteobacteria bacterium]|jgi:transketolase|nr:transketolase [Alphaproteobacteria bacterium]
MTKQAAKKPETEPSDRDMANAIRALAMDAVEKANSGHPGMPMGMADAASVLVRRFLKFDAAAPDWPDRDRLVLSAGHGSMLLYAMLYLTGYPGMGIEELQNFRQLGSKTPGHPEYEIAPGIETTTGPLGQGISTAVGMALAERMLAAHFPGLVDHRTYVIASDGDLMEGVSQEAISLAGHLKLSRLIVLYDDNHISIDGPTDLTYSDDVPARFKSCHWAAEAVDGHDPEQVAEAIARAQSRDRPSLIACRTVIGFGAPHKQGTAATHGSPLGAEEVAAARKELGWPHPPFVVPEPILKAWRRTGKRGTPARAAWEATLAAAPEKTRHEWNRRIAGKLPATLGDAIAALKDRLGEAAPKWATRKASGEVLETLVAQIPELVGGSGDLTGSNLTQTKTQRNVRAGDYSGSYIHFGVREHGMAACLNGLALHGGLLPYGGTFLVFADYCRPAIRLSALMGLGVIYVMTHDSIGLGEDGPTHQPVEHLAALRAMPNLYVFRPADAIETAECWQLALERRDGPSVLALSRQNVPPLRGAETENLCRRGGYVLRPASTETPRVTLMATGTEVGLACGAARKLEDDGIATAVVSLPCFELFEAQGSAYREEVLGAHSLKIAVEAASPFGWDRYVGPQGAVIGMTDFGASAPAEALYRHFGITVDAVVAAAKARL